MEGWVIMIRELLIILYTSCVSNPPPCVSKSLPPFFLIYSLTLMYFYENEKIIFSLLQLYHIGNCSYFNVANLKC